MTALGRVVTKRICERNGAELSVVEAQDGQRRLTLTIPPESVDIHRLGSALERWNAMAIEGVSLLPLEMQIDGGRCAITSSSPRRCLADASTDQWLRAGEALCGADLQLSALGWPQTAVPDELIGVRADGVPALASPLLVSLVTGPDTAPAEGSLARSVVESMRASLYKDGPRIRIRRTLRAVSASSGNAAKLLWALGLGQTKGSPGIDEGLSTDTLVDIFRECRRDAVCVEALDSVRHLGRWNGRSFAGVRRWMIPVLVALLVGGAALIGRSAVPTGNADSVEDPFAAFNLQRPEWTGCGNKVKCATVSVPLDWNEPAGQSIDLAVGRRIAATTPALGTLVVIPGGPSSSGVSLLQDKMFTSGKLAAFTTRWDVIVWDGRGTGLSTHLGCGDEVAVFQAADPDPDTSQETEHLRSAARAVAKECGREDSELLGHVDTAASARDLDLIRRVVGVDQVNLLGVSYGTYVSMSYARQFPDHVRSVVLDSSVDPAFTIPDLLEAQAEAMESFLVSQFDRCTSDATYCAARDLYSRVEQGLDQQPLELVGGAQVGSPEFLYAVLYSSYVDGGFEQLLDALVEADRGDGNALREMADAYQNGTNTTQYLAVACLDLDRPRGVDAWAELEARLVTASPHLGALLANEMLPCATWPVPPEPQSPAGSPIPVPALLVVGDRDPVTPKWMTERAARLFTPSQVNTVDKAGHPAFTDECALETMLAFLEAPSSRVRTRCA